MKQQHAAAWTCERSRWRHLQVGLAISFATLAPAAASGQTYPYKPVRIVAVESGGGADFNARLIAQGLTQALGQQVIVDNRRNATIAAQTVSKSAPDGYTLFTVGSSFWLMPFLQDNVPFDPVADFTPIGLTNHAPNVLVVPANSPIASVKDLIAAAKVRPGALNYASGASGASSHLAVELFKVMAGVDIVRIPYKGAGPAVNALVAGQVDLMFASAGSSSPHIRSGRLNALAVASAQPSGLFPGLPTVAAAGVPGYESSSKQAMFGPARMPDILVRRVNEEVNRILAQPQVKQRYLDSGVEPGSGSPQQFAASMKAEMSKLGNMIKQLGIRGDQ